MQNNGFSIMFTLNGNFLGNMFVTGDMLFSAAATNLYQYFPYLCQYQHTFFVGSQQIYANSSQKLGELGLHNMSIVDVRTMNAVPANPGNKPQPQPGNNGDEGFLNIAFNVDGKAVNVLGTKNDKFSDISKKLCTKADVKDKVPSYLLNNSMIYADESRTLNELHIQNNQKIEVVFTEDVIGAYY